MDVRRTAAVTTKMIQYFLGRAVERATIAGRHDAARAVVAVLVGDDAATQVVFRLALVEVGVVALGAASIFALKIAKNGGPRAVLRTAQIAEAAGIALYGGTMLEGAIGTLASAHAFVTINKLTWATELFGPLLLTEEIVTEAPVYRDFQLEVPRTPGLGLTLDEERLAFFARK